MPTTENLLTGPAYYKELRQTGILPEHIIIGTAKHAANKFVRSRRLPRAYEDAIKGSILSGKPISQRQLINLFEERYVIYEMKEAS